MEGAKTRASSSHSMADDDPDLRFDDDESTADGSFSTRFSATRLRQVADSLTDNKKEVIRKGSFGTLLSISSFSVPADLLDWVVMRIDTDNSLFSNKKKSIFFTKDMVRKFFNVPSGPRPVELLRRNEPHVLREPYRAGSRAPIKRTIEVLKGAADHDVVTIDRSWVLLCMAIVLSPGTGNMVPLEYLESLVDMDKISEFAWDEHVLCAALKEVKKYQQKREAGKSGFWIGGCLPMFAIIYMDFVEVPRVLVSEHRFNYSLPRACFVCNNDFKLLEEIDKNKLSLDKIDFGKRNFRRLPETPYVSLEGCNEAACENLNVEGGSVGANPEIPSNAAMDGSDIGDDVCGSLDEWLQPLPSSQDLEIPEHMIPYYEKHKRLHAAEVKNVLSSFGQILQSMFCKRIASVLVEANSTPRVTKEQNSDGVSFHATGGVEGNATTSDQNRASTHTSPPPQMIFAEQEAEVDREVAGCTDTNKNNDHQGIGLDNLGSSDKVGKEDVHLGQDKRAVDEVAVPEVDEVPVPAADEVQGVLLSQGTVAALAGLALEFDDGPSCSLFKEGTDDYEWLNMDPETARKVMSTPNRSTASPVMQQSVSAGPTFDRSPHIANDSSSSKLPVQLEAMVPCFDTDPKLQKSTDNRVPVFDASPIAFTAPVVSSVPQDCPVAESPEPVDKFVDTSMGCSSRVRKAVKKRKAQFPDGVPKMKKIKIDRKDDALYQQYVMSRYKIPKPKKDQVIPDFIEIEGFHTSLQNFHGSLKPRAEIDSEIMTLYLKTFNLEQMYNRKRLKKFAFSVFMGTQLALDPLLFDPKNCEREFRRACEINNISNTDLLFITLVQNRHWAVVVVNLQHKQFNVFDSIKTPNDVSLLEKATNNVITNFKKVASLESSFKIDVNCFEIVPIVHPTQGTHYNCGLFTILYLENFNGVVMSLFDESYIPNLRKRIAASLIKHPSNTLDPADQLRKLLEL